MSTQKCILIAAAVAIVVMVAAQKVAFLNNLVYGKAGIVG